MLAKLWPSVEQNVMPPDAPCTKCYTYTSFFAQVGESPVMESSNTRSLGPDQAAPGRCRHAKWESNMQ
jgi:hypothetical protein